MRFLLRLLLRWANWLVPRRPSSYAEQSGETTTTAPCELSAKELVTRFILSEKRISKLNHQAKPEAFYPPPDYELSVVHSTGLLDRDVWEIGRLHTLSNQPGRDKIHGRADVPVKALVERKLRAIRDDNPFKRHTSVIGWPKSEDPDERKEQRNLICLELSLDPSVKLVIPESPITRSTVLRPETS
jgi:hypothetical protein